MSEHAAALQRILDNADHKVDGELRRKLEMALSVELMKAKRDASKLERGQCAAMVETRGALYLGDKDIPEPATIYRVLKVLATEMRQRGT